jgi:hypothetical protein
MTSNDKKVVLLRYLLEGGVLTINIEDVETGKSSKEVVGLQGNDFGVYGKDDKFGVIENITLKQYLFLAESIEEDELTYLMLNKKINEMREEKEVWT